MKTQSFKYFAWNGRGEYEVSVYYSQFYNRYEVFRSNKFSPYLNKGWNFDTEAEAIKKYNQLKKQSSK